MSGGDKNCFPRQHKEQILYSISRTNITVSVTIASTKSIGLLIDGLK